MSAASSSLSLSLFLSLSRFLMIKPVWLIHALFILRGLNPRSFVSSISRDVTIYVYSISPLISSSLMMLYIFCPRLCHPRVTLARYPTARWCNRFQNPTTHALLAAAAAAACCTFSSSPPPHCPAYLLLSSQCHRCGGTGDRPREHGPGNCARIRRVVIICSRSKA